MAETATPASKPPVTDMSVQCGCGQPGPHLHTAGRPGMIGAPKQNAGDVGSTRRPPTEIPPYGNDPDTRPSHDGT